MILVLAFMASVTACGTQTASSTTAAVEATSAAAAETTTTAAQTTTTTAATQATTQQDAAATQSAASEYATKVTIQYANVTPLEGYDYNAGDPYAKFWADKFNWELDVIGFTWENWTDMLRIWVNSQDVPDVSVFSYGSSSHPDAASWAEQGLIKKLPDDWRQRWPNASRVFGITTVGPVLEEMFGGVYYLPRPRFDINLPGNPLPFHQNVYIRRDWAEAVGFPIKDGYKTSEFMEYARLVKEKDPGGVGTNLVPIAVTSANAVRMFIQHNSTNFDFFYQDDNGDYQWGPAHPDTLVGLKLMQQAHSEGLLHPEFYTLLSDQDSDMFRIAGTAASVYMDGTATGMQVNMIARFEASTGLDSTKAVHAATPLGEDGKYHQRDLINYWCVLMFSPDIKDEVFERFMDALDFGCTEEGYRIQVAGFEGEDYEWREGEMISLLPEGMPLESSEGKYPSIGGYMLANMKLWDDFSFDSPVVNKFYRDRSRDMYAYKVQMGTPDTFVPTDWTVFTHDSPSRRQASYNYTDEFANIVSSSSNASEVEANLQAWIDSQMPIIQPVLDELNALR